jgi:hypothetical protein
MNWKTDRLKEMREARHAERSRPQREEKKAPVPEVIRELKEMIAPKPARPDPKPIKPAPHVATKRKKQTAEIVGEAKMEVIHKKSVKRQISIRLDAALLRKLRLSAAAHETTQEAIVGEAIAEILAGKYRP